MIKDFSFEIQIIDFSNKNQLVGSEYEDSKWWALDYNGSGFLLLALVNGIVVGSSSIKFRRIQIDNSIQKIAHLGHHYTKPEYRNKGIFSTILRKSEEICESNNANLMFVTPNNKSFNIYQKFSFIEVYAGPSSLYSVNFVKGRANKDDISCKALDCDNYFNVTEKYPRTHSMLRDEFTWRVSRPSTSYNFTFAHIDGNEVAFCYRKGLPGPVETFVVSEIFINQQKPTMNDFYHTVKKLINHGYVADNHQFIIQSFENTENENYNIYRSFPILLKPIQSSKRLKMDVFNNYQLTDSDYG